MNPSPLTLKNPKGWFAAGAEVAQALMILSDVAFKLYIYLCLNARRDTGVLHSTQTDLAKNLKKSQGTIRKCLREMEAAGICQCHFGHSPCAQGIVEITEPYWPYQRGEGQVATDATDTFVSEVRRMLEARACVRPSFSTADEVLARQWCARGLPLERIEQAILLGCARKYSSWRNNQNHAPIASLRFFEPILEEVEQQKVSPDYWDYLRPRIERIEKLWIAGHKIKNRSSGFQPARGSNDGGSEKKPPAAEAL
jgi:hypothetical protein